MDQKTFRQSLDAHIRSIAGKPPAKATRMEVWTALAAVVVQALADDWYQTARLYENGRMQAYFSMEYLQGRSLLNNLINLDLLDAAKEAMAAYGLPLVDVLEEEPDAALGNGGLGRLAACFLDASATRKLPVKGYGLLYRYGLFRQELEEGFQKERPDVWMEEGYPFVIRHEEEAVRVSFHDFDVMAYPYDMPITGYRVQAVNLLRFWRAQPVREFDFELFNRQKFVEAVAERNLADDISRVLYPNDTTDDGKRLRIRQQYFLVSASLQDLIRVFIRHHGTDFSSFARYNSIQLNDTHPVFAIPELMRLLLDVYQLSWENSWSIVQETFAFTNHTTMPEALESWEIRLVEPILPRIVEIIREIDRRFRLEHQNQGLSPETLDQIAPVGDGRLRMASLACLASRSINGVAALHTQILKRKTLAPWHTLYPERFNNKTNGVTPRRWLKLCNPLLSTFLTELHGSDAWVTDLAQLSQHLGQAEDAAAMQTWRQIKQQNKKNLADVLWEHHGFVLNPEAIFDVQIKRFHEYKRQILLALAALDMYFDLKDNPAQTGPDLVILFGGKAAPGYRLAKGTIKLINEIAALIDRDPKIHGRLKVVFLENYRVSQAERIIPAADVSEQISMAGKEASGTGNMKLMMNGALTLGTYDGANIEIVEAVGEGNAYIFGAREETLLDVLPTYDPHALYQLNPRIKRLLDALVDGTLDDQGSGHFADIRNSLIGGPGINEPDRYYVLGDFEAFRAARAGLVKDYTDQLRWAQRTWANICLSGRFSADRTIQEYAADIWQIEPASI